MSAECSQLLVGVAVQTVLLSTIANLGLQFWRLCAECVHKRD